MSVLENWDQWKNFLGDKLDHAKDDGMASSVVTNMAFQVGDYLAKKVDPKNEQERVLSDLWSVATDEERHAIANMMVKLVKNEGTR